LKFNTFIIDTTKIIKGKLETLSKNKIKWIKSLKLKKNRDNENLFIIEGKKIILETIKFHSNNIKLICSTEKIKFKNIPSYIIDKNIMKEISSLKTPNNLIAIVKKPIFKNKPSNSLIVVLDNIQDPGNMGSILRTCDWFKVDKVICSKKTVDIFNTKVIQSSMGSIFRIPVEYHYLPDYLKQTKLPIYGTLINEGENIYKNKFIQNEAIIIIGNEGNGISKEIISYINKFITIPRFGKTESLNASIATGIILSEFRRMN
tara:strand:- start:30728 stop:31507 length:780 start_codon:yes stop_codon:yes gene_type:complete